MRYSLIIGLLAVVSATACNGRDEEIPDDPPANPNRSRVLATVPLMNGLNLIDTTGTPEAERRLYRTVHTFDSVSSFYHNRMRQEGWTFVNNLSDSLKMNLYLRKDSATVWIRANPRPSGVTELELLSTTVRDTVRRDSVRLN